MTLEGSGNNLNGLMPFPDSSRASSLNTVQAETEPGLGGIERPLAGKERRRCYALVAGSSDMQQMWARKCARAGRPHPGTTIKANGQASAVGCWCQLERRALQLLHSTLDDHLQGGCWVLERQRGVRQGIHKILSFRNN